MHAFIDADAPCFALGVVEEHGRPCAFLALRPEEEIPAEVSAGGFNFGKPISSKNTNFIAAVVPIFFPPDC